MHPVHSNARGNSQGGSKAYQYKEKQLKKLNKNEDELLDSDILNNNNNSVDELQSPLNQDNLLNHGFFSKRKLNNNLSNNFNILMMNSEQQSASTLTVYNSGLFDEASIMRILDKSISDDSAFQDESNNRDHIKH